jgi:CheY-like chemotaxis protein
MAKILLVEDDKSLREIYGVRLSAEGYEIVSAGDGEEALAMAIKERPDLIVSDVMMPKISGFDMLDILRSTTETKDVKVIMMTALSSEDQRARGESLGADRYLVKSQVGIEDVVRTVHDVLGDSLAGPIAAPSMPTAAPEPQPVAAPAQPNAEPAPTEPAVAPAPIPTPAPVPVAPAPIEAPFIPQPVSTPVQPVTVAPTPFTAPAPLQPVAPVTTPIDPASQQATPTAAPTFSQPVAPVAPVTAPAPVAAPAAETPTPAPGSYLGQPPTPPAAEAPISSLAPAPETTPAPVAMPQPTAPFSTPAPASLGERVIAPLTDYNGTASTPDLSSQIEQALNNPATPGSNSTPTV